jgi:hypothetical protein
MSRSNPLWGAPRLHGELMKLGISLSQAVVSKYKDLVRILAESQSPSPLQLGMSS